MAGRKQTLPVSCQPVHYAFWLYSGTDGSHMVRKRGQHHPAGGWQCFYICSWLSQFFVSFMGGVFADRYDRKKLIISADTVTAPYYFSVWRQLWECFRQEQDLLAALLYHVVPAFCERRNTDAGSQCCDSAACTGRRSDSAITGSMQRCSPVVQFASSGCCRSSTDRGKPALYSDD